jgi:short-subunit dehydrogenase
LIYNVGIWEHNGFSKDYNFEGNSKDEILNLINTNISSCILAIQAFIENLKKSENAKIILIGSTWALDNHNGKEVTFSATKFALRGITHSLRENLRDYNIGVSILNIGTLATKYGFKESVESIIEKTNGEIPLQDVIQAVKFIISTSNATCVKEINMPAMKDSNI